LTEETTPKPAAEKAEESTLKQAAKGSKETTPKTVVKQPEKTTKKHVEKKTEVVLIGNKPVMTYVMAVISALSSGDSTELTLKARGRTIATAVDVAEVTRNRFIKNLRVTAIGIGTEEMPAKEDVNKSRNISILEIKLAKK
jgi:DNA-binding protein